MTEHFTEDSFTAQVLEGQVTAIVDFWASWCGPCKMLGPVIDELAEDLSGKILVGKVNVDEESGLAQRYGVMTIPTVIFFKNGEEKTRLVGVHPKQKFSETALTL